MWLMVLGLNAMAETDWCDQIAELVSINLPAEVIQNTVEDSQHAFTPSEVQCIGQLPVSSEVIAAVNARIESPEETAARVAETQRINSQITALQQREYLKSASPEEIAELLEPIHRLARTTQAGAWVISSTTSPMDDMVSVVLKVDATRGLHDAGGSDVPSLIIRCKERDIDVYVYTGMIANNEYGNYGGATIRIRIDHLPLEELNATESTSLDSLFFPKPDVLAQRLIGHETLLFEFTPFHSSPHLFEFPISGLDVALKPLSMACAVDGYPAPIQ